MSRSTVDMPACDDCGLVDDCADACNRKPWSNYVIMADAELENEKQMKKGSKSKPKPGGKGCK